MKVKCAYPPSFVDPCFFLAGKERMAGVCMNSMNRVSGLSVKLHFGKMLGFLWLSSLDCEGVLISTSVTSKMP